MLGAMIRSSRSASGHVGAVAGAAGCAALLVMACNHAGTPGAKLTAAGSSADDGSGLLAKASVKFLTTDDEGGFEPVPQQQGYASDYYGGYSYGGFGGDWYGGGYGGSMYSSYQPYAPYPQTVRPQDYTIVYNTAEGGAIEGELRWPKAPKAPATIAGPGDCGNVANDSLRLGASGTVEGAVVYLEKITSGRPWATGGQKPFYLGGTVEKRGCALTPRVQVLGPVPAPLVVSNGDELPIDVVIERLGDGSTRIEQHLDSGGIRATGVATGGITRVADKDGALTPAWVVAQAHPYYALTDARGSFRIDDIAPGEYVLVAWHPPVVTGVSNGVVQYGEPVMVKKKVTVKKTAATKVKLEL